MTGLGAFFMLLFNDMKKWIIAAGAALIFIGGVYLKGVRSGKNSVKDKNRKELLKHVKNKKKIDESVDSLDDESVTNQLRDDWKQR